MTTRDIDHGRSRFASAALAISMPLSHERDSEEIPLPARERSCGATFVLAMLPAWLRATFVLVSPPD
jgi:hypothetical protein